MEWLRLYSEMLDDPKIQRLLPPLFKIWVNLLCLANKNESSRGELPCIEDIAFCLRISEEETADALQTLKRKGLIDSKGEGFIPRNWVKRQPESDNAAKRMQEKRDKEKGADVVQNTLRTSSEHVTNKFALDKNREDKNREEGEGDTRTGAQGDETVLDIPPFVPLRIEEDALQQFGFTPNMESAPLKPTHPDPASPYPLKLYQMGASQGYSVAEIREAGRIAHEDRGVALGGTFTSYASKCLPKARENLANKPAMPTPIDPEEAKRAKAARESERLAWEAEQLADLDRKIENGRRKREERERNAQATATE